MSENKTPIRRINGHALVDEQARSDIEELKVGGGTGGITQETDPTVPAWAKTEEKPTYTAAEVGADPTGTATKAIDQHDVDDEAHEDIRALITGLTNRLNALANSDDTTLDQMAEVVAYIKNNKALIDQITTGKISTSDIVDNLTTNVSTKVLSAAQGVALKALIDAIVVPSTLPNPQPIVINGESYDGSKAVTMTIQATEGGSSVAIDTTLTQGGQAADAAVVGEKLNELNEAIDAQGETLTQLNENIDAQDKRLTTLEQAGGIVTIEPADDDIPKVYFTGTTPTSKAEGDVQLFMRYVSKTARIEKPVTLKVQGDSSANYPKKNFTMKTYADSAYEEKEKLTFKGWPAMNKFVLKAHWMDHSHVRNVGTAKIWSKIVASRSDYASLPEELRTSANNGATDGFTCKVFVNGVYQGLYELIVPKDKLYGQDSDIATHSILNSEMNNQATCAFSTTSPTIGGNWSEELQDSMSSAISASFANLIKFVAGSTDEEFVANAEMYFDVQSVIDFDIFARVFCIVDNVCKNQIFFTYDGVKWYEGAWDLDGVLGNPPTVRGYFAYNTKFQSGYVAYKDHGITNLLYERVETLFMDRFKERYAELRADILSADNIVDVYERLTDVITTYDGLLEEDYASTTGGGAFASIPYKTENTIQQIRNFVAARLPYMDGQVEAITPPAAQIPCTGITLDKDTLTFTEAGTQTLTATVTPSDTTDTVVWSTNAGDVATVRGGMVTAKANGSAMITATCGAYSATCAVSVSGIEEPTEPAALIDVDSSTLQTGDTVWTDANGVDVFNLSAAAIVGDDGLLMSSANVTAINTVALTGSFTAETTFTLHALPAGTNSYGLYGFNLGNVTKYCDSIYYTGAYRVRGYDGDLATSLFPEVGQEITVKTVYDEDGIHVYHKGLEIGTYDKNSFTANGDYSVVLGWTSSVVATDGRNFSVRKFRLWNKAVYPQPTPCTGITLDKTTLTFTAAGEQTLRATVTPSDTTDTVVWTSDDVSVATVRNGVVTPHRNGNATITATCGAYSATCTVSVSGFEHSILTGIAWNTGYIHDVTGAITQASSDRSTDLFNVAGHKTLYIDLAYAATDPITNAKIAYFDINEAILKVEKMGQKTVSYLSTVPTNAVFARVGTMVINDGTDQGFTGLVLRETADGEIIGELPYP